jgi:hypothetical protein
MVCGEVGAPMEHVLFLVPHLVVLQLEHILEQGHVMTQRQNMMGSNVSEVVASHRLVHPQHTVQVSICLYTGAIVPITLMLWVRISIRARCTTLYDKVCQWLAFKRVLCDKFPVFSSEFFIFSDSKINESGHTYVTKSHSYWRVVNNIEYLKFRQRKIMENKYIPTLH